LTARPGQSRAAKNGDALETDLARFHAGLGGWIVIQQYPRVVGGRLAGKGAPDFLAWDGRLAVLFDAKSIAAPRWPIDLLAPHQAVALARWAGLPRSAAGLYLRTSEGDAWLPWSTVAPAWDAHWSRRARPVPTLSVADGVLVSGCDWTAALPLVERAACA
jgi:hypothetical protein